MILFSVDNQKKVYAADSWGLHEYHTLSDRSCDGGCLCRTSPSYDLHEYGVRSHAFEVHVDAVKQSINVRILKPSLAKNLRDFIRHTDEVFTTWLTSPPRFHAKGYGFLASYRRLRDCLDDPHIDKLPLDERLDLELFIEGFLEDGDIWDRVGDIKHLRSMGIRDSKLLDLFQRQRVFRGIKSLDNAFKAADKNAYTSADTGSWYDTVTGLSELDATPAEGHSFSPSTWETENGQTKLSPVANPAQQKLRREDDLLRSARRNEDQDIVEAIQTTEQERLDTRLYSACKVGDQDTVESLLGGGASPNCLIHVANRTCSPLIAAVEAGFGNIARLLILKGADISLKTSRDIGLGMGNLEYNALFAATMADNIPMIKLLLELGADIHEPSVRNAGSKRSYTTPLSVAAELDLAEAFRFLLLWDTAYLDGLKQCNMIGDSSLQAKQLNTLFQSIKYGTASDLALLLSNGGDVNAVTYQGTALSIAAAYNQPHKIKMLLDHGADVQLAALYLSRSNRQQAAKALVKSVYGSSSGPQNVRARFMWQYRHLVDRLESSDSTQLRGFKKHCQNYRQAWSTGIQVMERICRGITPSGPNHLTETLAFLAVGRAVTECSAGDTGEISLIDKFDGDLLRWQLLFPDSKDRESYHEALYKVWRVDLRHQVFLDLDFDDMETLGQFTGLISRLISGAQKSLGLDSFHPSTGLEESLSRWRQRPQEPVVQDACASSSKEYPEENPWSYLPHQYSTESRSKDIVPATTQSTISREQILQATEWLAPVNNGSVSACFVGVTGIAGDLMRGVIFSIVFAFIHGKMHRLPLAL